MAGTLRATVAIAVSALAVALLTPAGASGDGYVSRGAPFEVRFDVVFEDGEPKRVKDFRFRRVRIDCTTGESPFRTRSSEPFGPFRVNSNRRFRRTFTNTGNTFNGTTEIRGEFVTRRKVEGSLEINGDYPSTDREGCTSGKLLWTADLS